MSRKADTVTYIIFAVLCTIVLGLWSLLFIWMRAEAVVTLFILYLAMGAQAITYSEDSKWEKLLPAEKILMAISILLLWFPAILLALWEEFSQPHRIRYAS